MTVKIMAANNHLIAVNGVVLAQPYQCTWSLQDISAGESGRTDDTIMHKNRVGQKRKLQLAWRTKNTTETSAILKAFNPEYISVRYFDMMNNAYETREFYTGDRTANIKMWTVGRHLIETISLDIIER